jgi:hypothetical protein
MVAIVIAPWFESVHDDTASRPIAIGAASRMIRILVQTPAESAKRFANGVAWPNGPSLYSRVVVSYP